MANLSIQAVSVEDCWSARLQRRSAHRDYALYFDSQCASWEKVRKRTLVCVIAAVHLALIVVALRPLPSLSSKRDIVSVVLLSDCSRPIATSRHFHQGHGEWQA